MTLSNVNELPTYFAKMSVQYLTQRRIEFMERNLAINPHLGRTGGLGIPGIRLYIKPDIYLDLLVKF